MEIRRNQCLDPTEEKKGRRGKREEEVLIIQTVNLCSLKKHKLQKELQSNLNTSRVL